MLNVRGEVDLATVATLRAAIDGAVDAGARDLWIDLSETDFMDSTGLHALIEVRRRMHELRRRLAIICPEGKIRRLFAIAGVESGLTIYPDRESAHRGA